MLEEKPRVLIVEARTNGRVADALLAGAVDALGAFGAEHEVITAPGVVEIAHVVAMAEEAGHRAAGVRFDGYMALGAVIGAETYDFTLLSHEAARGLNDLAIGRRVALGVGLVVAEDAEEALEAADPRRGDRGGAAARACLEMIALRSRFLGPAR